MLIEFLVEFVVVTIGITLVVIAMSLGILYASGLYKSKPASIIIPAILAIVIGAAGPSDYTNLGQWAYFVLPPLLLSPLLASSSCRRLRGKE